MTHQQYTTQPATQDWVDETFSIKIPTPHSDALERMEAATSPYFDITSDKPLPLQIVESAQRITEIEISRDLAAREKASAVLRAFDLSKMMRIQTHIPADQKVRYGQVDMYMDEGDVAACLEGLVNASAVDSVYCVHPDKKLAQRINDIIETTDMGTTMKEIATTLEFYGNVSPVQIWLDEKEYAGTVVLNPKNVAVSRPDSMTSSNLAYRPSPAFVEMIRNVESNNMWYWTRAGEDAMFADMGIEAIPLRPNVSCHITSNYLSFKLYGNPRISRASRHLSTRNIAEAMRRSIFEGVKNQMIAVTMENPTPKEVKRMNELLQQNKGERIVYFAWRDNLKIQQILPGSIDELMAERTWEQINTSVFRNLNIPIHVTGDTGKDNTDPEVVKQSLAMLLMQARDIQLKMQRRYLAQWTNMFNQSTRISKKGALRPSHFIFVPTAFDAAYRIQQIIQPLATFGLISRETAAAWAGLRWDREFSRIIQEFEDGVPDYARPFTSFSQESGGSRTESISKPGRTPDRINPEKQSEPGDATDPE